MRFSLLVGVSLTVLAATTSASNAQTFFVNPGATYLRLGTGNSAFGFGSDVPLLAPLAISLSALGIGGGDTIRLDQLGNYKFNSGSADNNTLMSAVFSSSELVNNGAVNAPGANAYSALNRVPGALGAGISFISVNTLFGDLATDITQDFLVSDGSVHFVSVVVPNGATFLFVSPSDTNFGDNSDPDNNYGVRVTRTAAAAPEPTSIALLALILPAMLVVRRRAIFPRKK